MPGLIRVIYNQLTISLPHGKNIEFLQWWPLKTLNNKNTQKLSRLLNALDAS